MTGELQGNNLAIQKAIKTPSKMSVRTTGFETGSLSPRAKRMYGKSAGTGVTTFVDRSASENPRADSIVNKTPVEQSGRSGKRIGSESPRMDSIVNRGGKSGKGIELRDMNSNAIKGGQTNDGFVAVEEPPFTNFKGELIY